MPRLFGNPVPRQNRNYCSRPTFADGAKFAATSTQPASRLLELYTVLALGFCGEGAAPQVQNLPTKPQPQSPCTGLQPEKRNTMEDGTSRNMLPYNPCTRLTTHMLVGLVAATLFCLHGNLQTYCTIPNSKPSRPLPDLSKPKPKELETAAPVPLPPQRSESETSNLQAHKQQRSTPQTQQLEASKLTRTQTLHMAPPKTQA